MTARVEPAVIHVSRWRRPTGRDLSQLSHELVGRHRAQASMLDNRWTMGSDTDSGAPGNRSSRLSPGPAPSSVKIHRHTAAGLAPITRPGSVSSGSDAAHHRIGPALPGDQLAATVIDHRLPRVQRVPARVPTARHDARQPPGHQQGTAPAPQAMPRPRSTMPSRHSQQAARSARRGRPRRRSPGDPGTSTPCPGTAGRRKPAGATPEHRLGVAHRAEEPVPGLAAAYRAAHGITPGPSRDRAMRTPLVIVGHPIQGPGGTACVPRAIANSRPRSRTGSHGHSAVANTKAPSRHLRWSEH